MDDQSLVEVYRAKNSVQAVLFQQELADAGIRASVENGLLTGGVAELIGWSTDPRIMVESKDAVTARNVIDQSEHLETAGAKAREAGEDGSVCLACGAPLPSGRDECPPCGWSYGSHDPANDS